MTSCHDVTKPDLPISACRCARNLILFLFLCFFRSLSSNTLLISHLCDAVTSWRHVMTSLNLIYLSQLVDVLESWFFFCFHSILDHWFQICHYFTFLWCRDVMTSCHDVTKLDSPISACRWAIKLFLFYFHGFVGHWVQKYWWFFIRMMSWRHDVMTSCHDVTETV